MSFRVVARVLEDSDERLSRRLILIVLGEAAHDDGVVFLGQDEIARKARLARTHVAEELKAMEADGVLQIRKAQRGRKRISVYRLNLPCLPEIDYDRLPFSVNQPFDDVGSSDTVEADDVGTGGSTVSEVERSGAVVPLVVNHPGEPSEDLVARDARDAPPKLMKIDGRDQAFDKLASVCGVDPNGNRAREVGIALNGSPKSGLPLGIRALAWREIPPEHRLYGPAFEGWLCARIAARAERYTATMNGAMLTPLALAKWWTDIERQQPKSGMKFGRRAVSSQELLDLADRLEADQQDDERRALESG